MRASLIAVLTLFLLACSAAPMTPTRPEATTPKASGDSQTAPVLQPGDVREQSRPAANPAVQTLLARADQLASSGDTEAALAATERALRMAPRDPRVYYQLARLRLQRREYEQAEQLSLKGLSLRPDAALRSDLEGVLSSSRGS